MCPIGLFMQMRYCHRCLRVGGNIKKIMIMLRFTCFPGVNNDGDVRSACITDTLEIYDISPKEGVHVHCSCCFLITDKL